LLKVVIDYTAEKPRGFKAVLIQLQFHFSLEAELG